MKQFKGIYPKHHHLLLHARPVFENFTETPFVV